MREFNTKDELPVELGLGENENEFADCKCVST